MDPAAVEALLEEEEQKARAKDNAKNRSDPEPTESNRSHGSDGNRYSAEREENDQRRSRRSRDLAEDEDMKDASDDKGSANGSVRSRRKSRSPDRGRRSSREHDSNRLDRGGDYYSGGGRREVNRSDDDRYRPHSGDRRNRDRERERSPRRRDDRDRRDHRDYRRRSPEAPRRAKTPEPTDDERDRRTVFVQQLAARLRTKDLKQFFEQVGGVVDAQIVKDRVSGRSKGYVALASECDDQLTVS